MDPSLNRGSQSIGLPSPSGANMNLSNPLSLLTSQSPNLSATGFGEADQNRVSNFNSPANLPEQQGSRPEDISLPDAAHQANKPNFLSPRGSPTRVSAPILPPVTNTLQNQSSNTNSADPFAESDSISVPAANSLSALQSPANTLQASTSGTGNVNISQLVAQLLGGIAGTNNTQSGMTSQAQNSTVSDSNTANKADNSDNAMDTSSGTSSSSGNPQPFVQQLQQNQNPQQQLMSLDPRLLVLSANLLLGRLANSQQASSSTNMFNQASDNNSQFGGNLLAGTPQFNGGGFGSGSGYQDDYDNDDYYQSKSNKMIDFDALGLHRTRRKRRAIAELGGEEKWECPQGCGKVYCKTSTMSIKRHPAECTATRSGSSSAKVKERLAAMAARQAAKQAEAKARAEAGQMDMSGDQNSEDGAPGSNSPASGSMNANLATGNMQDQLNQAGSAMGLNLPPGLQGLAAGLPNLLSQPGLYPQLATLINSGLIPGLKGLGAQNLAALNPAQQALNSPLRGLGNPASLSVNLGPRKQRQKRKRQDDGLDDDFGRETKQKKKSTTPRPKKQRSSRSPKSGGLSDDDDYGSGSEAETGEAGAASDDDYTPDGSGSRPKSSRKRTPTPAMANMNMAMSIDQGPGQGPLQGQGQGPDSASKMKTTRIRGPENSPENGQQANTGARPPLRMSNVFGTAPGARPPQLPGTGVVSAGTAPNAVKLPSQAVLLRMMASAAAQSKPSQNQAGPVDGQNQNNQNQGQQGQQGQGQGVDASAPVTLGQLQSNLMKPSNGSTTPKLKPLTAPMLSPVVKKPEESAVPPQSALPAVPILPSLT